MNKFIFMGRLTRDPEIKYSGETCIARFSLAVDRRYKRDGDPTADFFNCTAFGKQGEFVEKYLKQGTKILCSGRIQNGKYTTDSGETKYTTNYILEEVEFAESKRVAEANAKEATQGAQSSGGGGFMAVPDDLDDMELPFN